VHGFRFYEVSVGEKFLECVLVGGDLGCVGVLRLYKNSCVSKKKSKGGVLSVLEKLDDGCFVRVRILIEPLYAKVKVFKFVGVGIVIVVSGLGCDWL